jgi:hypothetical protein
LESAARVGIAAGERGSLGTDIMDDKPEGPQAPKPDLAAAVRRARAENAERSEAIADLREIEAGRLALLESALKAVVRQAPPGVDMFDLTLTQGEHPRLFIDMVAFVDMGRDRRTYRFFQDTLNGRVLIAENQQIDRIVAAVTNYVARRLVERERALASGCAVGEKQAPAAWPMRTAEPAAEARREPPLPVVAPAESAGPAPAAATVEPAIPPRRGWAQRLGHALSFLLMTLGSITLIVLMALAGYVAWTMRVRDLWAHYIGHPPF